MVCGFPISVARTAELRACQPSLPSEGLFSALRDKPMLTDTHLVQDLYGSILDGEGKGRFTRGAVLCDVRRPDRSGQVDGDAPPRVLARSRLEEAGFVSEHMLTTQRVAPSTSRRNVREGWTVV
jgi:hypothetical protein